MHITVSTTTKLCKINVKFISGVKNGEESYWNKDGSIRFKDIYINGKIEK